MLTADLVRVRRQRGELHLTPLDERARGRALTLCQALLSTTSALVGSTRDEVEEAWAAVPVAPSDRRLADALGKLIEDRCDFDGEGDVDPEVLRRELFGRAAEARRQAAGHIDRDGLVAAVAGAQGLSPEDVERGLYADLRGAQRLRGLRAVSAAALVDGFDLAQAQAVLLRAERLTCVLEGAPAGACRALFHRLKFLRLLHTIERTGERTGDRADGRKGKGKGKRQGKDDGPGGGYRLTIDGPYSLFESATRYGLQLALALPALCAAGASAIQADVRWGKERTPLSFRFDPASAGVPADDGAAARLPDEVAALRAAVAELDGPWRASPSTKILDLPGVGLCVPDLEFRRPGRSQPVYLEVMGFWSREAVWRRVELVERGLLQPILFAVSHGLRVSEQALGDDAASALYVYKRVMNARAVLDRIDRLARRGEAGAAPAGDSR